MHKIKRIRVCITEGSAHTQQSIGRKNATALLAGQKAYLHGGRIKRQHSRPSASGINQEAIAAVWAQSWIKLAPFIRLSGSVGHKAGSRELVPPDARQCIRVGSAHQA